MENLNSFINKIKEINPKIAFLNEIPDKTGQNIINLILIYLFLFLGINKLISIFWL
jgi:hypothetical protein